MQLAEAVAMYFDGEKLAGVVLAFIGSVALAAGWWLRRGEADYRGMFWPVVLIGALQFAVGVGLYARTDPQVAELRNTLRREPEALRAREVTRMQRVQRSFVWIEVVEVVLLAVGVALALATKARPVPWGIGMGLVLQASVMLVFDLTAERRGAEYLAHLRNAPLEEAATTVSSEPEDL
jgi:hypothetical protein